MHTFLLVKLSLLPAVVFWSLSGAGRGQLALDLGAALGLVFALLNWRAGRVRPMETALTAFMGAGALAGHAGFPFGAYAVPASFIVQALAGLWTCWRGKPWTAAYAAAEHADVAQTQGFKAVNMGLSLLWSGLFAAMAALQLAGAPAWATTALVAAGALVSIFGPRIAVRAYLARALAARESFHWEQTPFETATRSSQGDDFDVAIVGAGLGGLTAAALLAQSGLRVFIADQHNVPGGYCHSWIRKARVNGAPQIFRFDSGVHDISGVRENGSVSGIFRKLGVDIDWARMRQSDWVDGALQETPQDWREHARALGKRHPQNAEKLMRFFETAKQIYDGLFDGAEKTSGVPLGPRSVEAMLAFAKAQPLVVRWMDKPFADFVDTFGLEPEARAELYRLSGYITDNPSEMTVFDMIPLFGYYFYGGFYPKGGSGVLGEKLAQCVARHGGEVALRTAVAQILAEDGAAVGLRLASGRIVKARAIISNADLKRTFVDLLEPQALPAGFRARIADAEPATSAFMVHLGLDRQPAMTEIAHAASGCGFDVGMIAPSIADQSAAPEGFGTLELIALMPYDEARRWFADENAHDDKPLRFSDDYEARKRAYGDRMIEAAERALPGLKQSIVFRADASPLTFQRYDWSHGGAIYGVAKKDRFKGQKSPLRNLWLAGAGNFGPGVEAVMIAGASVAEAIRPGVLAP
ncbi:MAG: NAD(P)/FAD-dependent oxidoreductase [Hyphomicrobiales bacterium]|nr:NAD(P)/FAD-dependent oxidoreductase [Hyphomicrobiales bacterium]